MGSDRCKRVREHGRAVSGWPLWGLRPWLVAFISLVIAICSPAPCDSLSLSH